MNGNNRGQKRERPFCTHCNYHGYTIDYCYKIHGYPPGFRQRQKNQSVTTPSAVVNQVFNQFVTEDKVDGENSSFGSFFQNLNTSQYQQLMALLINRISNAAKTHDNLDTPSTSYTLGTCLSISMNSILSSPKLWIIDSGASRHVCSNLHAFVSMKLIHNTTVSLLDHSSISVHFTGDVQINSTLLLKNVLFAPQFKFNLLSVSAFTLSSSLTVHFFPDYFII